MDNRIAAYISERAKKGHTSNDTSAANMPSSGFPFTRLPPELKLAVVQCLPRSDLLRLQRSSQLAHDLASGMIWNSLCFSMEEQRAPIRAGLHVAYAQRLMQALETLVNSDRDYAQYVRRFRLLGPQEEIGTNPNLTMFQLRFIAGSVPQQSLNLHIFNLLRRAKNLESFRINASLELSDAVWRELARKSLLIELELTLLGRSLPAIDNRILQAIGLSLSGMSQIPNQISYRHIEQVGGLKNLKLKQISELDHLEQIASCVRASSATLTSLHLSFASQLFDKARKAGGPTATVTGNNANPHSLTPPPLPDDDFDDYDESDLSEDETGPQAVNHHATIADNESIRKNRAEQEGALARILSFDSGKGDKAVEEALKVAVERKAEVKSQMDGRNTEKIQQLISKLVKGEEMEAEEMESLDRLRSRMDEAIRASKKARHFKPATSTADAKHYPHGKPFPKSGSTEANKAYASPWISNAYFPPPTAYPKAKVGSNLNSQQFPSWSNAPTALQTAKPGGLHTASEFSDLFSFGPFADDPVGSALLSPGHWTEHHAPKLYPNSSGMTQAQQKAVSKIKNAVKHAEKAALSVASPHIEAKVGGPDSAAFDAVEKDAVHTSNAAYEDMNIDIEHPDEINGDSGEDQESADEDEVNPGLAKASKGKGKAREARAASPPKPAKRKTSQMSVDNSDEGGLKISKVEQAGEKTMRDWIRQTHGLALEELALFGIPAKASVLGRALRLHCLKSIILLSVGGQGPFWQMMIKAQEEAPLSLEDIQTDDVSLTFVECISKLRRVKNLFLRRRSQKDRWNTTNKTPVTLEELRRQAIQPHIRTLEHLAIQNDQDGSWCMTQDMTSLICSRAVQLKQLAFQSGPSRYMEFLRYSRSPKVLPQLNSLFLISSGSDKPLVFNMNGLPVSTAGHPHHAHVPPPPPPAIPMSASSSTSSGVLHGDPYDSNHPSFLLDNYAGCVQATKDWSLARMEAGGPRLFWFGVRDRLYRMGPSPKNSKKLGKAVPLTWLREEYDLMAAKADSDATDSAARAAKLMPFEQWEKLYRPAFTEPSKMMVVSISMALGMRRSTWTIWSYSTINARLD